MPTELIGRLIELTMKPHCMEGVLGVPGTRQVKYGESYENKPYTIYVRFASDQKEVVDIVRKSDKQLSLSGYFSNGDDTLVFCALQAKEL